MIESFEYWVNTIIVLGVLPQGMDNIHRIGPKGVNLTYFTLIELINTHFSPQTLNV